MTTAKPTLEEILEALFQTGYTRYGMETDNITVEEASQALYEHIIEIVGEDELKTGFEEIEPNDFDARKELTSIKARNQLRAELRQKLKEYFGQDSKGQED